MHTPPQTHIAQNDTARLIPSKYSPDEASVLTRIADDDGHLQTIFALDAAANDRLRAMADQLGGIAAAELVTDAPFASVINAAFCHANPLGARFNGPERGAWYASFTPETSLAEVSFHHAVALSETDYFHDSVTYDTYLADFDADFYDIRDTEKYAAYLAHDDHSAAQKLAETLQASGANGVVYPSVRGTGDCIACFRPALVKNVRKSTRYRLTWSGSATPEIVTEG